MQYRRQVAIILLLFQRPDDFSLRRKLADGLSGEGPSIQSGDSCLVQSGDSCLVMTTTRRSWEESALMGSHIHPNRRRFLARGVTASVAGFVTSAVRAVRGQTAAPQE